MQASEAESNQLSLAISGLPASESVVCRAPCTQLRAPGRSDGTRLKHAAAGGGGKPRICPKCIAVMGQNILLMGDRCVEFLITQGKDPMQYEYARVKWAKTGVSQLPTRQEAEATLATGLQPGVKDRKRKGRV